MAEKERHHGRGIGFALGMGQWGRDPRKLDGKKGTKKKGQEKGQRDKGKKWEWGLGKWNR
jgi:hypothetical protein